MLLDCSIRTSLMRRLAMKAASATLLSIVASGMLAVSFAKANGDVAASCGSAIACNLQASSSQALSPSAAVTRGWTWNARQNGGGVLRKVDGRNNSQAILLSAGSAADAKDLQWVSEEIPIASGQYYQIEMWYRSNTVARLDLAIKGVTAVPVKIYVPPSRSPDAWQEFTHVFKVPSGGTSLVIAKGLVDRGTSASSQYVLHPVASAQFAQGLVSLTFDDSWKSVFVNAIPVLDLARSASHPAGLKSTQYVNTEPTILTPERYANNMSLDELLAMQSNGHEIAVHTRSHRDLVRDAKDDASRTEEIVGCYDDLKRAGIETVSSIAYPFGRSDDRVKQISASRLLGGRGVTRGTANIYNSLAVDRYDLGSFSLQIDTPASKVIAMIDQAIAKQAWLILAFHRVEPTREACHHPNTTEMDIDCVEVATLQAIADHLKNMPPGTVRTVNDVLVDLTDGSGLAQPAPLPKASLN